MTWNDLTAEERLLAHAAHVAGVRSDLLNVYIRDRTARWVDYVARHGCIPDGAGFDQLMRAAAVAVVAELARTPGV